MSAGNLLRRFIAANLRLSRGFDAWLFSSMTQDGNRDFVELLKQAIGDDLRLADIGGGKSPLYTPAEVATKRLHVTGVDIDAKELADAPHGAYAETICTDITRYCGDQRADVVVVQSLLEHVVDGEGAIRGIASFCRPGGSVYTFCPNRRAWFARLNRWLPEGLKKRLLYAIFPGTRGMQGFKAYYDGCTPAEMSASMSRVGLQVEQVRTYFVSTYFMFFFPLHVSWRLANYPLMKIWPLAFCETFAIVANKPVAGAKTRA